MFFEEVSDLGDRVGFEFGVVLCCVAEVEQGFRISAFGVGDGFYEDVVESIRLFGGEGLKGLPAPYAQGPLPRRVFATTWTGDRGCGLRFLLFDIEAADPCDFTLGVLGEHRDISTCDPGAADPSVMVLEVGLIQPLAREVRRRGFPKVGERDGLGDPGPSRGLAEHLGDHAVTERFGSVEFAPQRDRAVFRCWVVGEPPVDMRTGQGERDRPRPLFSFDGNLESVIVVRQISDREDREFAAPQSGVELEGDRRFVPSVVGGVDHGNDVLVPVEHFRGIRRSVVGVGGAGGDPLQALGWLVTVVVRRMPSEHPQCDPIVVIRLLVIVVLVDPSNEVLCSSFVLEGPSHPAHLLGHDHHVAKELHLPMARILAAQQTERVVERTQNVLVGLTDGLVGVLVVVADVRHTAGVDPLSEVLELARRVVHGRVHVAGSFITMGMNIRFKSLPGHSSEPCPVYWSA